MYCLSGPNSPTFAWLCATGAGPCKYFSFVSRHTLSHVRRWSWRDIVRGGFPASLTGILIESSPENLAGTPAGGFLLSSPDLWHLSEPPSHPVAAATPATMGTEFQPGLEEEEFRTVGGVFQVVPSLHTVLPLSQLVAALYIHDLCSI